MYSAGSEGKESGNVLSWSVLCVARYVFLQRTLKPWEARVGALGGARAAIRAQYGPPVDPYGVSDRVAVLGNYL